MSFICYKEDGCAGCKHCRRDSEDVLCCWAQEDGKTLDMIISKILSATYKGLKGVTVFEIPMEEIAKYGKSYDEIREYAVVRGIDVENEELKLTIYTATGILK